MSAARLVVDCSVQSRERSRELFVFVVVVVVCCLFFCGCCCCLGGWGESSQLIPVLHYDSQL